MVDRDRSAKEQLLEAGVPEWAPWSADDDGHARFYIWVDDAGDIQRALVGHADDAARRRLLAACRSMLAGAMRPGAPPTDFSQPTAVVLLSLNGSGYGVVSRSAHRPLGEMLALAESELTIPG